MAAAEIVDTPEEARAQERSPLLVRRPLEAFLDEHGIGSGEVEAERIGEGHSNVTYLIRRGGARVVLRRPPRPPLPPSAHDVLREARLLAALGGTAARVPEVVATCDDEAVIGVPFYVMAEEHGYVATDDLPGALDTPAEREAVGRELIHALAEIHAVDWRAAGLDWFGKPSGYLERQLRRFNGLWEHNKTRDLDAVTQTGEWLAANLPESGPSTIVHGDYRLGNVMLGDDAPARIVSVFDWELSTIGDPLADLGYLTVTWTAPGDDEDHMFANLTSVTRREGFPSRDGLVELYGELTGRAVGSLNWYQALALWKAAVFMEGNYKRYVAGDSDDAYLASFDEGVPALAEAALDFTRS